MLCSTVPYYLIEKSLAISFTLERNWEIVTQERLLHVIHFSRPTVSTPRRTMNHILQTMTYCLLSAQQKPGVDLVWQLTRGRRQGLQSIRAKHLERKLSGIGGERKNSAMTARKLVGGRQKTNNENMVRKFEGYKILVG